MGGLIVLFLTLYVAYLLKKPRYPLYLATTPCKLCEKNLTKENWYCSSCERAIENSCPECGSLPYNSHVSHCSGFREESDDRQGDRDVVEVSPGLGIPARS